MQTFVITARARIEAPSEAEALEIALLADVSWDAQEIIQPPRMSARQRAWGITNSGLALTALTAIHFSLG